jgi:hypothetical protein
MQFRIGINFGDVIQEEDSRISNFWGRLKMISLNGLYNLFVLPQYCKLADALLKPSFYEFYFLSYTFPEKFANKINLIAID